MAKEKISFESFLETVDSENLEFVKEMHGVLTGKGCLFKIEASKSGYVMSYNSPVTKSVLFNYVFRKKGLMVRIYGDNVGQYQEFLNEMPGEMIKVVEKAGVCRRLMDPSKCNARCKKGYEFTLKGIGYQKCRFNCFMFLLDEDTQPYVQEFIERELKERELLQMFD